MRLGKITKGLGIDREQRGSLGTLQLSGSGEGKVPAEETEVGCTRLYEILEAKWRRVCGTLCQMMLIGSVDKYWELSNWFINTEVIGEFEKNFSEMLGKKPDRGMFKRNERNRKLLIWKIVKEFFLAKWKQRRMV